MLRYEQELSTLMGKQSDQTQVDEQLKELEQDIRSVMITLCCYEIDHLSYNDGYGVYTLTPTSPFFTHIIHIPCCDFYFPNPNPNPNPTLSFHNRTMEDCSSVNSTEMQRKISDVRALKSELDDVTKVAQSQGNQLKLLQSSLTQSNEILVDVTARCETLRVDDIGEFLLVLV